ncbi:MAG: Gfo/Idh/MocA family oxidoreductase [Pseudomonadota bacterium]
MTLRVGCIGAGYFAGFHYDAWARLEGAQPVAAVDRDLSRAEATGLAAYGDARVMLADIRPDIVDIITPPPTHFETISAALEHAPKAIICQKPFCLDIKQAQAAAELAASAGVPLVIHENFRFQPWYRVIKSLMDAGEIGDLLQITFRLRPGDGQGPEAYLDRQPYFQQMPRFLVHETAVHWIDTFRYLAGAPKRVMADLRQMNPLIAGEDAGYILFDQGDGVRALFDGNRLLDHAASNTRCTMGEALVEGTKGTISLAGDGSVRLRAFGAQDDRIVLAPTTAKGFGGDCVYHLQAHVVEALRSGTTLENTAEDYLAVIAIEDAIYRSAEEGRWVSPDY